MQKLIGASYAQVFSSVVCVTCMQGQWICKDCPKICNGLEKAIISMN